MTDVRPRFDPVARRTISEEIRGILLESIRKGSLPPGAQLPSERTLCEEFGVARTSVREAIQGLASLGVIERRGNRAYVVEQLPTISFADTDSRKVRVRELFEVRRLVEVPIMQFAASRAPRELVDEIVTIAARFNESMGLDEFRMLDQEFHRMVALASGNALLAELYGKVLESLFGSEEFASLLSAPENARTVRQVIKESSARHKEIAAAISCQDVESVTRASEEHLQQVEDDMISRMV